MVVSNGSDWNRDQKINKKYRHKPPRLRGEIFDAVNWKLNVLICFTHFVLWRAVIDFWIMYTGSVFHSVNVRFMCRNFWRWVLPPCL